MGQPITDPTSGSSFDFDFDFVFDFDPDPELNNFTIVGTKNIMWTVVPGDAGDVCDTLPDKEVIEGVTKVLRQFTGNQTLSSPDRMYRQTWSSDPNFQGTYVYPSPTTKFEDFGSLSAPIPSSGTPRVLIAGEHTAGKYTSTLHGARQSGLQQAQKIIDQFK